MAEGTRQGWAGGRWCPPADGERSWQWVPQTIPAPSTSAEQPGPSAQQPGPSAEQPRPSDAAEAMNWQSCPGTDVSMPVEVKEGEGHAAGGAAATANTRTVHWRLRRVALRTQKVEEGGAAAEAKAGGSPLVRRPLVLRSRNAARGRRAESSRGGEGRPAEGDGAAAATAAAAASSDSSKQSAPGAAAAEEEGADHAAGGAAAAAAAANTSSTQKEEEGGAAAAEEKATPRRRVTWGSPLVRRPLVLRSRSAARGRSAGSSGRRGGGGRPADGEGAAAAAAAASSGSSTQEEEKGAAAEAVAEPRGVKRSRHTTPEWMTDLASLREQAVVLTWMVPVDEAVKAMCAAGARYAAQVKERGTGLGHPLAHEWTRGIIAGRAYFKSTILASVAPIQVTTHIKVLSTTPTFDADFARVYWHSDPTYTIISCVANAQPDAVDEAPSKYMQQAPILTTTMAQLGLGWHLALKKKLLERTTAQLLGSAQ